MPVFHLQTPAALATLAALPVLMWLWLRAVRRAGAAEQVLTGERSAVGANIRTAAFRLGALGLLVLGLSGPTVVTEAGAAAARPPVVFALDVSASMMADDVPPDRLTAGREAIGRMADLLRGAPLGLVVAGTDPVVACPLTEDAGAFAALLGTVDRSRVQYGTQLAPAVEEALRVLGARGGTGAIVLVSDGEDLGTAADEAIRAARAAGAVIHTLTVGSEGGVPVEQLPLPGDRPTGARTRARPGAMAKWAAAGGGRAWAVGPGLTDTPSAGEILPHDLQVRTALQAGTAAGLSWLCYAAAAVLLAVDLLLRG